MAFSRDGRRLRGHAAAAVHGHGSDPGDIERREFERMTGDASGNLMRFLGDYIYNIIYTYYIYINIYMLYILYIIYIL